MFQTKNIIIIVGSALLLAACSPQTQSTTSIAPMAETTPAPTTETQSLNSASPAGSIQTYTLAQLAEHAAPQDCWLAINGKVYDVSGFGDAGHPGKTAIYQGCGKDATTLFETRPMGSGTPHSDKARDLINKFYLGDLAQQ